MTPGHELVLYAALGVLGVSLVIPGVVGVFKPGIGKTWLVAETVDAKNHLRALNAMMAALGAVALYACWELERSRSLVLALGAVMAALVVARVTSLIVDGRPGIWTLVYLAVETGFAALFLGWPPPRV